jgi:hypothetical protein
VFTEEVVVLAGRSTLRFQASILSLQTSQFPLHRYVTATAITIITIITIVTIVTIVTTMTISAAAAAAGFVVVVVVWAAEEAEEALLIGDFF